MLIFTFLSTLLKYMGGRIVFSRLLYCAAEFLLRYEFRFEILEETSIFSVILKTYRLGISMK